MQVHGWLVPATLVTCSLSTYKTIEIWLSIDLAQFAITHPSISGLEKAGSMKDYDTEENLV